MLHLPPDRPVGVEPRAGRRGCTVQSPHLPRRVAGLPHAHRRCGKRTLLASSTAFSATDGFGKLGPDPTLVILETPGGRGAVTARRTTCAPPARTAGSQRPPAADDAAFTTGRKGFTALAFDNMPDIAPVITLLMLTESPFLIPASERRD
jgi:hypothetical protein